MKNYEKVLKKNPKVVENIVAIISTEYCINTFNYECDININCKDCEFDSKDCDFRLKLWLMEDVEDGSEETTV